MKRFIDNYIHKDTWITSEKLYEWFLTSHPNYVYKDFLKKLR